MSAGSPSVAERHAAGRAARERLPRRAAGDWERATRRQDALDIVVEQNATRVPELVPVRHGRMAASPWTYFRGAAAVMAADLAARPHSGLTVQLCGDAHVLNFGMWATPERQLSFDLRDFDETLPGPFEWDVLRTVASLQVLALDLSSDGAPGDGDAAVREALAGYRRQLREYAEMPFLDVWYDLHTAEDLVGLVDPEDQDALAARIARRARKRAPAGVARKLTERGDSGVRLVEAPPFRVHVPDRDEQLVDEVLAAYRTSLSEDRRYLLDRFAVVDVVRQVVGVGSVGMQVFLVLLAGSRDDDLLLLQVKQAGPSVYEAHLGPSRYPNHGQRVTVGRRVLQSSTDILVGWTRLGSVDFYVRQFRDMKVVPSAAQVAPWLTQFARKCGVVLARAHARTGDAVAIDSYLGKGSAFADAGLRFSREYAKQTVHDHGQLVEAIADGTVPSAPGW
jgi:uncharacterized protein (DUF2252 family)